MLIFICSYPRTGGMILCETLGQHSKLIPLNEIGRWEAQIKENKNFVIKPTYSQTRIENIPKKYPKAKIIFMERSPLQIAASYKKWEQRGRDTRGMVFRGCRDRKRTWFEGAEKYDGYLTWKKKFEKRPNTITIKFQDLILKKFETFEKIFKFIGLDMSTDVSTYISTYISDGYVENYPYKAHSAGFSSKLNNWREVLSETEINEIKHLYQGREEILR